MKKMYVIGCLVAAFALTMAGCSASPEALFDKQVKFYKERNERVKGEMGKKSNEEIDKLADSAAKTEFVGKVKAACDAKQIDKLVKYYDCAIDDYIGNLGTAAYTEAGLNEKCKPIPDAKVPLACKEASDSLQEKLKDHIHHG